MQDESLDCSYLHIESLCRVLSTKPSHPAAGEAFNATLAATHGVYYMVEAHKFPAILHGLLVTESIFGTGEDLLGYNL